MRHQIASMEDFSKSVFDTTTRACVVTELRLRRVRTGLTLRDFATKVGIPETHLIKAERGQSYIPPKWREPLASALGVPVEAICDPKTGWPKLAE